MPISGGRTVSTCWKGKYGFAKRQSPDSFAFRRGKATHSDRYILSSSYSILHIFQFEIMKAYSFQCTSIYILLSSSIIGSRTLQLERPR